MSETRVEFRMEEFLCKDLVGVGGRFGDGSLVSS